MDLVGLGAEIRRSRQASGISQLELAFMTQLSRATINYAERGRVAIGADALLRIFETLGLSIATPRPTGERSAVELIAQSASVSFRSELPAHVVDQVVSSGEVPDEWLPHIAVILDETSDGLLLSAIRDIAVRTGRSADTLWRNLRQIAADMDSPHPRWQHA
jgi:transcriptional regulator with XRE-family HTH domain